ncbi:MAG: serine/threonine-protein kinase [Cyanobacteriota bacterium]|nr:serine/threonine-protein kinase [Cyanobacteriota bacterium]
MQIIADRYQIQKHLGKQTGRQTFLARDVRTQGLVVIKVLSMGIDFEWQELKLFEREAQTLQTLNHPLIPKYLDYLEWDDRFALVQTYVEGKTLEEHLKAGRTFSEGEVRELAKSLLEILVYLHQLEPPTIHRDIKPSNILLGDRSGNSVGRVHLVDFGSVAHLVAREGGTITVVGTYGYMPPEQFGGRVVRASDLYGLGATLIYLATGLHPTELPQRDLRLEFDRVVDLDRPFADWLAWLTEPSWEQRPQSAREALQGLEKPSVLRAREPEQLVPVAVSPARSEAMLTKTRDSFEVCLPPRGIGFKSIALLTTFFPMVLYAIWGLDPALKPLSAIVAGLLFLGAVYYSAREVRLRIDRNAVSLTLRIFGRTLKRWQYVREGEVDLEKGRSALSVTGIYLNRCRDGKRSNLCLQIGKNTYKLGNWFSNAEIDWLRAELLDWLR